MSKVRYRKGSEMRRKDQLERVKEWKQGKGKRYRIEYYKIANAEEKNLNSPSHAPPPFPTNIYLKGL